MPSRPSVGVGVDREGEVPQLLVVHRVGAESNSGIREEEIDGPVRLLGGPDQLDVPGLRGQVDGDGHPARKGVGDPVWGHPVGEHDTGTRLMEAGRESGTDTAGCTGDVDLPILDVHRHIVDVRRIHTVRRRGRYGG